MTKSWTPRRTNRRYEKAGSIALSQVPLRQAPRSLRASRRLRRGLWFLLALAIAVGGPAVWLAADARFYVYRAQVVGTSRLSHRAIFEASGLKGLHILWARSADIEEGVLAEFPSLERARAACRFPANCTVSVLERQPRVLWNDDGQLWWIDEDGAIFPARGGWEETQAATEAAERWLVAGPLPQDDEGGLDGRVRVALTELWASGEDAPTDYDYSPDHGLSFVGEHGWRVMVGRGSGMRQRLRLVEQLAAHLESRGVSPRFVDVRFPKAPCYSPTTG